MKEGKPVSAHSGENGCGSRAEWNGNRDLCTVAPRGRTARAATARARAACATRCTAQKVRVGVDFVYVYGILNSSNTHL